MTNAFKNGVTRQLAEFISEIGLEIIPVKISSKTFLPGILVENGRILVDESKLTYPGDLLHEAGHLAVAPADMRSSLGGEVALPGVWMDPVEVHAIAWSYAAIVYLGLDPKIVFHEGGYGVESERLLSNYNLGVFIGANGLQDAGLTAIGRQATELGVPPYPHMLKWLRD